MREGVPSNTGLRSVTNWILQFRWEAEIFDSCAHLIRKHHQFKWPFCSIFDRPAAATILCPLSSESTQIRQSRPDSGRGLSCFSGESLENLLIWSLFARNLIGAREPEGLKPTSETGVSAVALPVLSYRMFLQSPFAFVNSRTNPSTDPLVLLI